jgi:putative membrane protein
MKFTPKAIAMLSILGVMACADAGDEAQEAGNDTAAAAPASQPAQTTAGPSDAEILHITKTANDADIEGGNMAKSKGQNADVKSYGNLMISDHTALNAQGDSLAQRASLTPASNPTSQQLMSDHQTAAQRLQSLSGAAFDKAYIAHEVDMHQKLLNNLDQTLIPAAQNADLKNALTQARAKVEAHLNRAKDIQGKIGQ